MNRSSGPIPKNDVKNLHKKALGLQKDGNQEEAIKYFDKALEFEPNNSELLYDKAISFQMLLRFDDAIEYYNKSLKIDPDNFGAFINKGLCLSSPNMNRQEDALLCFDQLSD